MDKDKLPITLEAIAAGESIFRARCAESFRGFAPSKAVCEAAAIAIYYAMDAALRSHAQKEG